MVNSKIKRIKHLAVIRTIDLQSQKAVTTYLQLQPLWLQKAVTTYLQLQPLWLQKAVTTYLQLQPLWLQKAVTTYLQLLPFSALHGKIAYIKYWLKAEKY